MWTEFEIVLTAGVIICSFVTGSFGYFIPGGFTYNLRNFPGENVTLAATGGVERTENYSEENTM